MAWPAIKSGIHDEKEELLVLPRDPEGVEEDIDAVGDRTGGFSVNKARCTSSLRKRKVPCSVLGHPEIVTVVVSRITGRRYSCPRITGLGA